MATILPFSALRPKPEIAQSLASRPYDVLNSEEARAEAGNNDVSFLHVTKAEIDLPPGTDIHSQQVYDQAKQNLEKLMNDGSLFKEEKPCYYIYQLIREGRSQTGLVCISSVEDYFNDTIKKHEFTRPEKEKDRIDHMRTIRAQTGNVFLAYRDVKELDDLINGWKKEKKAAYEFVANDRIQHSIWIVDEDASIATITRLFKERIPFTYIADGHHRAASAAKVSQQLEDSEDAKYF